MKKLYFSINRKITAIYLFLLIAFALVLPSLTPNVYASQLTTASLRFDRMAANGSVEPVLVEFTPNDATSLSVVKINFATGIGVSATAASITTSTSNIPSACTAVTVTGNDASAVAGQLATFDVSGVSSTSTLYCFYITAGITNPSSTGQYISTITTNNGSADLGSTDIANDFISSDQVTVSAVVPPSFTFTLGSTSTSFTSNLSSSTIVDTTGVNGTVVTNAANGWTAYLKSTGELHSTAANYSIATSGTPGGSSVAITAGSEYYQLVVDAGTGTPTIPLYYVDTAAHGGAFNSSAYESIASGTGPTATQTFSMKGRAAISGTTPAANDYSDTWTVIAAGNF